MKLKCKSTVKNKIDFSERGSSSVLVVMIMLLLITFGVLAMMSSYSNLKISRKHAEWTRDYYRLESIAESEFITFQNVFNEVRNRFDNGVLEDETDEMKKKEVLSTFLSAFLKDLNTQTYFSGSVQSNFDAFTEQDDENVVPMLSILTKDDLTERRLLIVIQMDVNIERIKDIEFKVMEWREIPAEFEYDDALNFSDPEGN
ncbi:MAG TPA: hypothetical protein DCS67_12265 [Clostridiales bacterium UBA8960]|nr:hypothetical protein [Clostridiales bacterium UBA8960]